MNMNHPDIIKPVTEHPEWLFKKMAGRFEGWSIKSETGSSDVPISDLDYFAVRLLSQTIELSSKTVLAVPRTTPGLSLSLVSYLTINRFIRKNRTGIEAVALMFDGFKAIPIEENVPVVVITKNRKLRDYYVNSDITFSGHRFPFKNFPLYRIKRSGELTALTRSSDDSSYKIAPVVFYHLDQLETIPTKIKGAAVLIELDSQTGFNALNRMKQFLEEVEPSAVFAVTNTFATPILEELKRQEFNLVVLRPEIALKYSGKEEFYPSFSSAMANIPSLTEVHVKSIHDEQIEILLQRLTTNLNKISKDLGQELPSIFFAARTILATLKNLSVPLGELEDARKRSGYLKSIKFLIDRIFTNRYIDLSPAQESVILPVWSAIGADFYNLYNNLKENNPKFIALSERIKSGELTSEDIVVVYDTLQAGILKDTLIDPTEEKDQYPRIETVKDINRNGLRAQRLISSGLWQLKDEATVLSAMPEDIEIISYRIECPSVKFAIKRLQEIDLASDSSNSLQALDLKVPPEDNAIRPWIISDEATEKVLNQKINLSVEEEIEEVLPDYFFEIEDLVSIQDSEDDEEAKSYIVITTSEGEKFKLDASKDVLAYTEGSKAIKSVNPEHLAEGDSLLALDNESNKEIFQEIAARTKELSGANQNIINQWDEVLTEIRRIKHDDGERTLINILTMLKCEKTETTMRQWFKGVTLAPKDEEDINSLLKIANIPAAAELAPKISEEIDKIRVFHRRLGKRIHSKMSDMAKGEETKVNDDVDMEIDEILDLTHLVKIEELDGPTTSPLAIKELLVLR